MIELKAHTFYRYSEPQPLVNSLIILLKNLFEFKHYLNLQGLLITIPT